MVLLHAIAVAVFRLFASLLPTATDEDDDDNESDSVDGTALNSHTGQGIPWFGEIPLHSRPRSTTTARAIYILEQGASRSPLESNHTHTT